MILVDTNVWVHHFRLEEPQLAGLLTRLRLVVHPFVVGELALGNLRERAVTLAFLRALPSAPVADHAAVLALIEGAELFGREIGYVDAHLLASLRLLPAASLWTRDKRLRAAADELGLAADLA